MIEKVFRCERCGLPGHDVLGEIVLCDLCLVRICLEWRIRFDNVGTLAK